MLQFLQLTISGAAIGCIYALIALGFVLIYKATETVNFAQGDLMMIGGFVGLTAMAVAGLPFWLAFVLTIVVMILFGMGT
ncbi:MAG: branched-chain amino acid ABC transporter permease, partial [Sulfuritalea sp.]|nr:branched-chain amino acid ABC transporter permease [Sulfuritalea sp.]